MKNITLIISALLLSIFSVNAQDNMYVMKGGTATYTIPITQIDSVIFYAPGSNPGGGGGGGGTGAKCGDYAHVTKSPNQTAAVTASQVVYSQDFSSFSQVMVYNASYDNPALTAAGSGSVQNGEFVVSISKPAPSYNDAWHVAITDIFNAPALTKGDDYTFSIDMRTTNGANKVVTVLVTENGKDCNGDIAPWNNQPNQYSPIVGKDFLATGTKTTFTCKWRPHFGCDKNRLLIWVGGDATGLAVDNIKITRTGTPATPGTITTQTGLPEFDCATAGFKQGAGTSSTFNSANAGNTYKKHYSYTSPATGTSVGLDVVLPPDYATNTSKKYPVIYYLHGHGETEETISWNNIDKTLVDGMNAKSLSDVILVSIGGPANSWWSDGDNGVKAESHIIYEILPLVDANFRTLATPASRAIMGFSMGGWGASKLAIKYPAFFKACMTWCGALYTPGPVGASINGGFWDGITSIVEGKPYPGFAGDYAAIWSDNTEKYAYDCGRAMLPVQATQIKSAGVQFFIHENNDPNYFGPGQNYDDQFMNHSKDFVKELQALTIPATFSQSVCVKDHSNANDAAPHSPKNITAADIQKILNVLQKQ